MLMIAHIKERRKNLHLLQGIVLDLFLLATILEYLRQLSVPPIPLPRLVPTSEGRMFLYNS